MMLRLFSSRDMHGDGVGAMRGIPAIVPWLSAGK
jgi:hypothetical protein